MKPFLVAIGVVVGAVLVIGALYWFDRSGSEPPPEPFVVTQPKVKPIPDGGLRVRPYPDRAGLRYSPPPP